MMNHEGDVFFNPITLCFYQRRKGWWGSGCSFYGDAKTTICSLASPPRYLSGALVRVDAENNRFSVETQFGWRSRRHPNRYSYGDYYGPLFLGFYWGLSDALTSPYSEQLPEHIMCGA